MRTRAALVAALLALVLVGCAPDPAEPSPPPAPSATPTLTADPMDPTGIRATGTPVTSGAVTLTVSVPGLVVAVDPDGSARASVPGDVLVAAPEGLTITALSDGTAAVRDGSGAFVAGLTTDPWGTGLVQVGPDVVRLDDAADLWFTSVAVESAVWGEAEGGRSLAVTPSAWARARGQAAQEGLWAQVVALAPEADTPGMKAQLECHELGAPDKATWNLEPWRPDVDAIEMIRERCNP
ncbi:DUF2599 domain-containing protein [Cellulomonas sp. Leaf334]|uniref:DUF2599 domain-containing protein n=1 Tax=Cellulomonas sp. Leaf334 TaxID=1736339 RepID=UPI0006FD1635|nr:DUF2599 domain-containing protein [Cellulomonas sp. Leaf334]KQR08324.1 hypothetical protein ASF78_18745 [Cellulomonas sp. Leaf334]